MFLLSRCHQLFTDPEPAQLEWRSLINLIRDVQEQEYREQFAAIFYQWDLILRQFRWVEQRTLIEQEPSREALLYHALCLHALISVGKYLQINVAAFPLESLKLFNIPKEGLDASVRELEHVLNQWHGDLSPQLEQELKDFCNNE